MGSWGQGARLVAERGLVENLRSRTLRIVTGLLLLLSVAAVTVPQILAHRVTTYTLATVGPASGSLVSALDSASTSAGFRVRFVERDDAVAVREAVRDGDATAGLAGDTLYTSANTTGTFPVVVAQAVVALETSRRMVAGGLTPQQVADVLSVRPPQQVTVSRATDPGRAWVGFAVGIILYLALTFAGNSIATTVAMEKATRISEVLLAVLRPSQILVGTVAAVGAVTLAQLLILATPLAVSLRVSDTIGIPSVAASDLTLALAWFVLGFALYGFLFAAAAALVNKITEVSSAVMPVTVVLVIGYLLAIIVVNGDPSSVWSVILSLFPLTAPLAMPIRWAAGSVPVYQLVLAMTLTAGTAVLFVAAASSIYRRALVITGHRVRLREVLGRRDRIGSGP